MNGQQQQQEEVLHPLQMSWHTKSVMGLLIFGTGLLGEIFEVYTNHSAFWWIFHWYGHSRVLADGTFIYDGGYEISMHGLAGGLGVFLILCYYVSLFLAENSMSWRQRLTHSIQFIAGLPKENPRGLWAIFWKRLSNRLVIFAFLVNLFTDVAGLLSIQHPDTANLLVPIIPVDIVISILIQFASPAFLVLGVIMFFDGKGPDKTLHDKVNAVLQKYRAAEIPQFAASRVGTVTPGIPEGAVPVTSTQQTSVPPRPAQGQPPKKSMGGRPTLPPSLVQEPDDSVDTEMRELPLQDPSTQKTTLFGKGRIRMEDLTTKLGQRP